MAQKREKTVADRLVVWLYRSGRFGKTGDFPYRKARELWHIIDRCIAVNRKQMRVLYKGRVQGVGFRYTAKSVANGFEVTGTIRNLSDGRVELIAEGVKGELDGFRQAIQEAGLAHFIDDETVSWTEAKGQFRGFEIVS